MCDGGTDHRGRGGPVVAGGGGHSTLLAGVKQREGNRYVHVTDTLIFISIVYTLLTGPLIVSTDAVQVTSSNPDVTVCTHTLFSSVDNETETVTSYHYTAWPEQSIAHSVQDVADMYSNVLQSRLGQTVSSVRACVQY